MTHAHRAGTPAAAGTPSLGVLTRRPTRALGATAYAQELCRPSREAIREGQGAWKAHLLRVKIRVTVFR